MRYFLVCIMFFSISLSSTSFRMIESAYQHEDYAGALAKLNEMKARGHVSAALYYDLSCVNYKMGNNLQAFINNRKAAKFEPMDQDNNHNQRLIQKNFSEQNDTELSATDAIVGWLSWGWLLGLTIIVWGILICLWVFFGGKLRTAKISLGVLYIAFLVIIASRIALILSDNEVVLSAERASIHSGPGTNYPVLYWVHQGLMGIQTSSRNEWCLIRLSNGDEGWTQAQNLAKITFN